MYLTGSLLGNVILCMSLVSMGFSYVKGNAFTLPDVEVPQHIVLEEMAGQTIPTKPGIEYLAQQEETSNLDYVTDSCQLDTIESALAKARQESETLKKARENQRISQEECEKAQDRAANDCTKAVIAGLGVVVAPAIQIKITAIVLAAAFGGKCYWDAKHVSNACNAALSDQANVDTIIKTTEKEVLQIEQARAEEALIAAKERYKAAVLYGSREEQKEAEREMFQKQQDYNNAKMALQSGN